NASRRAARDGDAAGARAAAGRRAGAGGEEARRTEGTAAADRRVTLVVRAGEPAFARVLKRLRRRGATADAGVEPAVRAILDDVQRRGDRAVAAATLRFDRVKLNPGERTIERAQMRAACDALPKADLRALRIA